MSDFNFQFGRLPTVKITAPGRINLIGEHIDYLGGKVMPIAIERGMTVLACPREGRIAEIHPDGFNLPGPVMLDLNDLSRCESPSELWMNYIIGVISVYRDTGIEIPGFCATISSNLPIGAGLSSSAALETATALLVEFLYGVELDVIDRALLCQRAEHEFAGVPCGIMDQIAVGAGRRGHALLLDCGDLSIEQIPMPGDLTVVTADTGVKHALGDGAYRKRREDCEEILRRLNAASFQELDAAGLAGSIGQLDERLFRRARHVLSEMQRVDEFAAALKSSDRDSISRLMRAGHDSLRLDYEVSCPELDFLVEAAYGIGRVGGVVGSRMTGGGFGGSTVTLVESEFAPAVCAQLEKSYEERFGRPLNCFITSARDGAATVAL
jgi:galactokinase